MLMPLPVLRHGRHQLFPVNSFRMPLSVGVSGSPPRSSSELRQDDESSKLEQRRLRGKQPQLRNILLSHNETDTHTGMMSATGGLSNSAQHLVVHPLEEHQHIHCHSGGDDYIPSVIQSAVNNTNCAPREITCTAINEESPFSAF